MISQLVTSPRTVWVMVLAGEITQGRPQILGGFAGMARVPTDGRENAGKSFRELNRTGAARQIGPDANDFVDAGCLCPFDDL